MSMSPHTNPPPGGGFVCVELLACERLCGATSVALPESEQNSPISCVIFAWPHYPRPTCLNSLKKKKSRPERNPFEEAQSKTKHMTALQPLHLLARYNVWANAQVLRYLRANPTLAVAPVPIFFGSYFATVAHIAGVDEMLLAHIAGVASNMGESHQ